MKKKPFVVIGYYEAEGQICGDRIQAEGGADAIRRVARARYLKNGSVYSIVAAVEGDGTNIEYVGDSVSSCGTILGKE